MAQERAPDNVKRIFFVWPDGTARALPVIAGGTSPTLVQEDFRFRNDDGTLATATWIDGDTTNNNNKTIAVDSNFRLRFVAQQTNGSKTFNNLIFQLRYSYNDGGYSAGTQVTTSSTYVQLVDDGYSIADHATTQQRIGDGTYGTGDSQGYNDGTTDNLTGNMDFNGAEECEIEVCLQIVGADLNDGDTLDFRLYQSDGTVFDSYSNTPRATANKPIQVSMGLAAVGASPKGLTVTPGAVSTTLNALALAASGLALTVQGGASSFPQVAASNTSQESSATTTHTVSLPTGINSGDLLLVFMAIDAGSAPFTSFPGGWTEIKDTSESQNFVTLAVAYRVATGSEGSTISVSTTPSAQSAHASYRITGHDSANPPEISTGASGDSNTADPDSLTPGGGSDDYLWIALCAVDGSGSTGPWAVTAAPTNYTNLVSSESGGATDGATIGVARRELTGSSENPGTFTIEEVGGKEWFAATVGVYPGVAGVNVSMGLAAIAASAPSGTITPGAVSTTVNALALIGSGPTLTVTPGEASTTLNALALAALGEALTVTPGAVSTTVNPLQLATSGPALTITPGAISITLNAANVAASTKGLTVTSLISVALNALALSGDAPALTVTPGDISTTLNALALAGLAPTLTVTPGAVSITLNAANVAASTKALLVTSTLFVAMNALALAGSAPTLTVTPGAVSTALNALALAGLAPSVTVTPGAVSITLNVAGVAAEAKALTVTSAIIVALNALALAGLAPALTVTPGAISITLNAGALAASGQTLTVTPGAVSVALDALQAAFQAQGANVSAVLEVIVNLAALALAGSGESLAVTPGAVSTALNTLALAAGGLDLAILLAAVKALTLQARDLTLTLDERDITLDLRERDVALALDERDIALALQARDNDLEVTAR